MIEKLAGKMAMGTSSPAMVLFWYEMSKLYSGFRGDLQEGAGITRHTVPMVFFH